MGDASTHAIKYQGYWVFVVKQHDIWLSTATHKALCIIGAEEESVVLP